MRIIANILCGGEGKRLSNLTKNKIPKPLINFPRKENNPFLYQLLTRINLTPITDVRLIIKEELFYQFREFKHTYEDKLNLNISIHIEQKNLYGTGCFFSNIDSARKSDINLIINGDTFFEGDINSLIYRTIFQNQSFLAIVKTNRKDVDIVNFSAESKFILNINKRSNEHTFLNNKFNFAYAGICSLNSKLFNNSIEICKTLEKKFFREIDLEKDIFNDLVKNNSIKCFPNINNVFDYGTELRFYKYKDLFPNGFENKVIFWDRDNTLNLDSGYTGGNDELKIIKGRAELMLELSRHGFSHVVISNQSAIERKILTKEDVDLFNSRLRLFLWQNYGIWIADFFYCPHKPDNNNLPICDCRKPNTKLFSYAIKRYNITIKESFLFGDKQSDIDAATKVGLKSAMLLPNMKIIRR